MFGTQKHCLCDTTLNLCDHFETLHQSFPLLRRFFWVKNKRREQDLFMWKIQMLIYKPNLWTKKKNWSWFHVCSLRDDTVPPPPRPLHLPLPADVIPGRGHVLHRPPAPSASVRGAGGRLGRLPAAHEAAPVGLLDMADHAVTESDHRWRHIFISAPSFFPILEGAQAYKHLSHLARLCTLSAVLKHSGSGKREKCVIPEICSFHICLYICTKVAGTPLFI